MPGPELLQPLQPLIQFAQSAGHQLLTGGQMVFNQLYGPIQPVIQPVLSATKPYLQPIATIVQQALNLATGLFQAAAANPDTATIAAKQAMEERGRLKLATVAVVSEVAPVINDAAGLAAKTVNAAKEDPTCIPLLLMNLLQGVVTSPTPSTISRLLYGGALVAQTALVQTSKSAAASLAEHLPGTGASPPGKPSFAELEIARKEERANPALAHGVRLLS